MCGPSGMGNTKMRIERAIEVDVLIMEDSLFKHCYLTNFSYHFYLDHQRSSKDEHEQERLSRI